MNETIKDVYITMLSKNINWGAESRAFEAQWLLCEVGVPMTVEIVTDGESEWKEFSKWTEE
jgi:hypothetical protein